ncbi:MAG: IPExxxVDY family protein [Flavobacteriaceae bacterium]|nr:IPExxxVDY family protein [Flavobacteriaceae bacterium]
MSKIHSFDFEYDHDYILIGIHTTLNDYRLAYFLNKELKLFLKRSEDDLDFSSKNCSFPFYLHEDEASFISWSLISNKFISVNTVQSDDNLFDEETKTIFLVPEKKKIDYFIKISGYIKDENLENILSKIKETKKIITSYTIDPYTLKSRDNLIF